jgi:hypothetical protein
MIMYKVLFLFLAFTMALLGCAVAPTEVAPDAADDPDGWSKPVHGLQARLCFTRKETFNGTPVIATYLELRNNSNNSNVIELPVDGDDVQFAFTVSDADGKSVSPADGPFDEIRADLGLMRLPFDSLLRLNIAHRGAGVPKDYAAHLDLGPLSTWNFKRGDKQTYYLQAKLTVKKRDDKRWSGTITIPKVKLPTSGE